MTTATKQVTRPTTVEGWLQALTGALTTTHRPDRSTYTHLSEAAYWEPIRDDLQEVCRLAHRGELPNDWRWEMIYDLAHKLLEYSEPEAKAWDADDYQEVVYDIAQNLGDFGTTTLAAWISENASRADFDDEIESYFTGIPSLMRWRQIEEIQSMAFEMLNGFERLT
jgi:hypothetical protein